MDKDDELDELKRKTAKKVLKKHFKSLYKVVTQRDIIDDLYAHKIIDDEIFEFAMGKSTAKEKGVKIVYAVQKAVQIKFEIFNQLCEILQQGVAHEVAQLLKDDYTSELQRVASGDAEPKLPVASISIQEEEDKLKKILNTALKNGHVVVRQRKVLLVGVTGTGKSSLLRLLLKEDSPQVRHSTHCAERPIRVVRLDSTTPEFVRMSPEDLMAALAKAMKACTSIEQEDDRLLSHSSPISLDKPQVLSQLSTSEPNEAIDAVLHSTQTEKELMALLGVPHTDDKVLEVDWTYIIDTGGQPQFMEILPNLLRGTCLTICVFKLSEELSAYPMIEYYDRGMPICQPVQSAQTNEQFLKNLTSSMQSFATEGQPSILFVGTHRDLEHKCAETREEKEQKIFQIVIPALEDSVVCSSQTLKQFIFAINAKDPKAKDRKVAKDIQKELLEHCSTQTNRLPLRWYGLELKLEEIANLLGQQVLTKDVCLLAAKKLHFTKKSFEAALCHLNNLNILFYYPDILPNVVFCDPQVLLDKITELVEHSFRLRDSPQQLATHSKFRKFRDRGIVTIKLLHEECFSKHYTPGVFSPSELVTLFRGLLIFADLGDGTFFMLCLLDWLDKGELSKHRVSTEGKGKGQESTFAPLIFNLPNGPMNGLFCSFISSLISKHDSSPVPPILNVDINPTSRVPVCLKHN